jgi:hypothetical protein
MCDGRAEKECKGAHYPCCLGPPPTPTRVATKTDRRVLPGPSTNFFLASLERPHIDGPA